MKKITKKEVKDKRLSQVVSHLRLSGLKMSATMLKNLQNKVIQGEEMNMQCFEEEEISNDC